MSGRLEAKIGATGGMSGGTPAIYLEVFIVYGCPLSPRFIFPLTLSAPSQSGFAEAGGSLVKYPTGRLRDSLTMKYRWQRFLSVCRLPHIYPLNCPSMTLFDVARAAYRHNRYNPHHRYILPHPTHRFDHHKHTTPRHRYNQ